MISYTDKYRLELRHELTDGPDTTVTYVESRFNRNMNRFIESNLDEIRRYFLDEGLEFNYLPAIGGHSSDLIAEIQTSEVEPSLVSATDRYKGASGLWRYCAYHLDVSLAEKDEFLMLEQFRAIAKAYSRNKAVSYATVSDDSETVDMLNRMESLARALRLKGVKPEVFDNMLRSLEGPSRMVVKAPGNLAFPELGNIEISLNPMEKALYTFFLKHLEGLAADNLAAHRKELSGLYARFTLFDDPELIEETADSLCESTKATFYTVVSRIKRKIEAKLGRHIASNYIIRKDRSNLYGISLPRELVEWK